jgi:hypothetical protein
MSNKLIESFLKLQSLKTNNIFEAAKKAKKLDPVGKEDEDIDNDGDSDKSDKYLHNRRKAIKAAMKETTDPNAEGIAKDKQKAPIMVPKPDYPTSKPGPTRELKGSLPKGVTVKGNTNEEVEVEFSETELAHIAAILEGPVAPQDDTNTAFGKTGSRTGTVSEEEEVKKRGRGRPVGSKSGARTKDSGGGEAVAGSPTHPHPFHQIRASRPDSEGNYNITREEGGKVQTAKVPAKAAAQYHASYLAAGKPTTKEALTNDFVSKHFPGSKPKASGGISLPKMPAPKS